MATERDETMKYIMAMGLCPEVAAACRIEQSAVRQWKRVPPARVLVVERTIKMKRSKIRPDLYPSRVPKSSETNQTEREPANG